MWGLGIGDWGLGNPQSPIPNPQKYIYPYIKHINILQIKYNYKSPKYINIYNKIN